MNGPASSCPSSTTRTPASGPGAVGCPRVGSCDCGLGHASSSKTSACLGLELRNQEVARLEHVLRHHELGPLGVARGKGGRDLAVVVLGDELLLRRIPHVGSVDERELDDAPDHLGKTLAAGSLEDHVVEANVLLHELGHVVVRP